MAKSPGIDTLLLACTHYPLLRPLIRRFLPKKIKVIEQGHIVAKSLQDYLRRHPEMESKCSKNGSRIFHTTGSAEDFDGHASLFYGENIASSHVNIWK
jgi:glutamate racemase